MNTGWFNESWRHSLARKGIRTVHPVHPTYFAEKQEKEPSLKKEKESASTKRWRELGVRSQYEEARYQRLLDAERQRTAKEMRSSEPVQTLLLEPHLQMEHLSS
jgi:hypothetical protein